MAVSVDTKVKELMKNTAAADVLEKFAPGFGQAYVVAASGEQLYAEFTFELFDLLRQCALRYKECFGSF